MWVQSVAVAVAYVALAGLNSLNLNIQRQTAFGAFLHPPNTVLLFVIKLRGMIYSLELPNRPMLNCLRADLSPSEVAIPQPGVENH